MSGAINNLRKKTKFTQISNICLYDENLSLEAKALLTIINSFHNDWKFYNSFIAKKCGISLDKLNKLYKMLEVGGYLKRSKKRDEKGKFSGFDFEICDEGGLKSSVTEISTTANLPLRANPQPANTAPDKFEATNTNILNNTKKENNTNSFKKEKESIKSRFSSFVKLEEEILEGEVL